MGPRPVLYNPAPMRSLLPLSIALVLCAEAFAAPPRAPEPVVTEPVLIIAAPSEAAPQPALPDAAATPPATPAVRPGAESPPPDESAHGPIQEVVLQALALLGTPYRWGGQSPGGGFDCSGLVNHVMQQAMGIVLPRSAAAMSRVGAAIERSALRAGDLLFFVTRKKEVSHVGIYVGENRFVHATRTGGDVRVSALSERYWSARYVGARRIAGE